MKKYLSFAIILISMLGCTLGYSQKKTTIEEQAKAKNIKLPPRPWHMMVLRWEFEEHTKKFEQIDIDVTIDRDISEEYNLYISPINAQINGASFYGGLQTNINGWVNVNNQQRVHKGKGGIFSRWSVGKKNPIGIEYVDMKDDGLCESAGYEGEFCSVRRPFKWSAGTYTISLIKEETITLKKAPHTWVKMVITDHKNKNTHEIGRILFEKEELTFSPYVAAFVEIYSTTKIAASDVPEVIITFGYPKLNGKKLPAKNVIAYHTPKGLASSPNCADVFSEKDNVSIYISPELRPQTTNTILYNISLSKKN